MINAMFSRWVRSDTESLSTLACVPVNPPPRRAHDSSILQSILRWLPSDSDPWGPAKCQALLGKLPQLRSEFASCLADLDGARPGVRELQRSIQRSRSLRDFWHLRTGIYTEVARAHSQWEAEQRLAGLNRHFPLKPVPVGRGRQDRT